ncbi:uncharacterized protein RG961_009224 isoform 1-T1 [Leptosomus discolor]
MQTDKMDSQNPQRRRVEHSKVVPEPQCGNCLGGAKLRTDQRPEAARRLSAGLVSESRESCGSSVKCFCSVVLVLCSCLELGAASDDSCSVQHRNWCGAVTKRNVASAGVIGLADVVSVED